MVEPKSSSRITETSPLIMNEPKATPTQLAKPTPLPELREDEPKSTSDHLADAIHLTHLRPPRRRHPPPPPRRRTPQVAPKIQPHNLRSHHQRHPGSIHLRLRTFTSGTCNMG